METILDLDQFYIELPNSIASQAKWISLKQFITYLPTSQLIFFKNIKSIFQGCNNTFSRLVGSNSTLSIIGKTDFDLMSPIKANEFRNIDVRVFDSLQCIEDTKQVDLYFKGAKSNYTATVKIIPFFDALEKLQGLLGVGAYEPYFEKIEDIFNLVNKTHINQLLQLKKYRLKLSFGEIYLSKRETECLLYLMKGKITAKEIANEMCIHYRTVEDYVMRIKEKMRCHKKSELISLAYENDFLNTIQKSLKS